MKNHNILVNRKPLNENDICSKRDFEKVLKGVKHLKPPIWKTAWFYGPVGLASVALTVSVNTIYANEEPVNKDNKKQTILSIDNETSIKKDSIHGRDVYVSVVPNIIVDTDQTDVIKQTPKSQNKKIELIELIEEEEINQIPKEQIIEEKITLKKIYPSINNVYTGDITFSNLCSEDGIQCGESTITTFSIQYFNGLDDVIEVVDGNRIPEKACEILEKYNKGQLIYITKIKGFNSEGVEISFPSMSYIPRY